MILDSELDLARKIARRWSDKWRLVEYDDLASTLVLWLFENEETVERYRFEEFGEGKLFVTLRRQASKYCAREQSERQGGPLDIDAPYTVGQIERALPYIFEDVPQSTYATVGNYAPSYSGTHSEALAIITDLRGAYLDQPDEVQETVALRFRDGMSYTEIGRLTGTTRQAATARVTRAVARLHSYLASIGSE